MSNGQTKELILAAGCSVRGDSTWRPVPCFCFPPPPPQPPIQPPPPAPSHIEVDMYEHILEGGAYGTPYELVEAVGVWAATFGSSNPGVPNGTASNGPFLITVAHFNSPWDVVPTGYDISTPFWLTYETSFSINGYPSPTVNNAQVSSDSLVDPTTGQPLTGQAFNAAAPVAAANGMNAAIRNAYTAMGWNPDTAPVYTASPTP